MINSRFLNKAIGEGTALRAVVYTSVLCLDVPKEKLAVLMEAAVKHNRLAGVSGALLHDGRRFVQYLEGPSDGLSSALGRIQNATSHHQISFLADGHVTTRMFPNWSMRTVALNSLDITEVARANWQDALSGRPLNAGTRTGLELMLAHVGRLD